MGHPTTTKKKGGKKGRNHQLSFVLDKPVSTTTTTKKTPRNSREHSDGRTGDGPRQVDAKALIETPPSLLLHNLRRSLEHAPVVNLGVHRARDRGRRDRSFLHLQPRPDHLVRIGRDRRRHLRRRRAEQDRRGRQWRTGIAVF